MSHPLTSGHHPMSTAPSSSSSTSSSSSSRPPSVSSHPSPLCSSISLPSFQPPLPSSSTSSSHFPSTSSLSWKADAVPTSCSSFRSPDSRLPSHHSLESASLHSSHPAASAVPPFDASSMRPYPPRPSSSPPPLRPTSSSLLPPDAACYPKKRCTLAASSHGKRSRDLDVNGEGGGQSDASSSPIDASAQHLQLPLHLSSLSIQTTRSPSPSYSSPSVHPARSTPSPSSPCPYTSLSPQSASLFSALASLPVHEFKSLLCPLLPHLLAHDPSLPSLLLSRFISRSRWQSMDKNLLAKAFSFLDLTDLLTVTSVSHHFKQHSTHQLIWTHLIYDAGTCPPVRSDRSLQMLCEAMQRQRIPLTRMRLTGSSCSGSGLASLALLAPTLTYLDLSCMGQVNDCSMLSISKLSHLSTLHLNSTSISSSSIRYLRCLPFLTHLSVLYTHVDQSALSDLLYLPLTTLAICASSMSSKGYKLLGNLPDLRRLQLGCLQAHSLYKLSHLQQVEELEFTCISDSRGKKAGVEGRDREEREEAAIIRCALDLSSLGELKRLTTLNLGMGGEWDGTSMTAASLFEPLTLLPSLTHLQITCCPLLSNVHLTTIAACRSLVSLQLEGSMTCCALQSLASLTSLTSLHLTSPHIGDNGLYFLSLLPLLSRLHLSHPHLTRLGLHALGSAPSLRALSLECATLDDGCGEELRGMGGWVEVDLRKCVITRTGWERVQKRKGGARLQGCSIIMEPCNRATAAMG